MLLNNMEIIIIQIKFTEKLIFNNYLNSNILIMNKLF